MGSVTFQGDDPNRFKETGAGDGKGPAIPLTQSQTGVTEELISKGEDPEDEEVKPVPRARRNRPATVNEQGEVAQGKFAEDDNDDDDDEDINPGVVYRREALAGRIGDPLDKAQESKTVAQQLDEDDKVPMMFQKEVRLLDQGFMHVWSAGVHMVPISLVGTGKKDPRFHWYLKAHKVRHVGKPVKADKPAEDAA